MSGKHPDRPHGRDDNWKRVLTQATFGLVFGVGSLVIPAGAVGGAEASTPATAALEAKKPPKTTTPPPTATPSSSPSQTTFPTVTDSPSPSPTAYPTMTDSPNPSPTATTTTVPTCADGVSFEGQTYCPGYIVAMTTYAVGTRIVLQSVAVWDVAGTQVTVAGGPSCIFDVTGEPGACGDIIPSMNVDFVGRDSIPAYGDVIDLYGTTGRDVTLIPAGFVVVGHCDPYWGEC